MNEGAEFARSTYNAAWDTAGAVWRALTSKTARRTLLTTMLVSVASAFLFGLACLGYLAFYHEYLPDQVTTVPVHLQYGYELNPYGVVSLDMVNLKDYQDYDISVTLNLPRSPANLGRGNFMVALHLLDNKPPVLFPSIRPLPVPGPQSVLEGRNILYTSTRPAIVPYTDPLVSLASRLLFLAYHVFFPTSETTKLVVPMVERLEFRPGTMSPTSLVLDVQAGQTLQVYSVFVTITAQLHGLRWFMHTYWITSFVLFTTLFWLCELFFAGIAVLFLGLIFGNGGSSDKSFTKRAKTEAATQPASIKQETEGTGKTLEDVPMTFPTSSRQPPLRYDPEPSVSGAEPQADLPPAAAGGEADDEDDDEEGYETRFHDSGIGTTSYSERDGPGSLRRRTSRGRGRD